MANKEINEYRFEDGMVVASKSYSGARTKRCRINKELNTKYSETVFKEATYKSIMDAYKDNMLCSQWN